MIRVQGGLLDAVAAEITELHSTGYVAVIAGDHDLMVDAFFRDVPHLNQVLHDVVQKMDGVVSVTSYLVTDIRYESSVNLVSLLDDDASSATDAPSASDTSVRATRGRGH